MQYFIFILFFSFILYLFYVYILSKDDVVLLRKNISLEQVFNIAFIAAVCGLFGSRLLYVIGHFSLNYLNPLVFFLFPYFPGLSLVGAISGGLIGILLYSKYNKIPIGRIIDFLAVSLLLAIPFGYLGLGILSGISFLSLTYFFIPFYFFLFLFFSLFLLPKQRRNEIKEGSIGLLIFATITLITLVYKLSDIGKITLQIPEIIEIVLYGVILCITLFFLNKLEEIIKLGGKK